MWNVMSCFQSVTQFLINDSPIHGKNVSYKNLFYLLQQTSCFKIWKQSDPSEALIITKIHKNCRLGWICTWGMQHPSRPLAPALAVLNSQHLKVLASMIPMDQKNISTLKWSMGQLFTAATRHFTPAAVKYKNMEAKWCLGSINHNKIT
jgi:hypothetical protein